MISLGSTNGGISFGSWTQRYHVKDVPQSEGGIADNWRYQYEGEYDKVPLQFSVDSNEGDNRAFETF